MRRYQWIAFLLFVLSSGGWPVGIYLSNSQMGLSANPQRLEFIFSNTFVEGTSTNAGVNWLRLRKPSFIATNSGPGYTNVFVNTFYDGVTLSNLVGAPWSTNWAFTNGGFMASNAGNDLFIVLGNAVTNNPTNFKQHIWVGWNLIINSAFTSDAFQAWVDTVQTESMPIAKRGQSNWSTTGPQQAVNTATISAIAAPPGGYASITPSFINQDTYPFQFTLYIQNLTNTGFNSIKYAAVNIPSSFTNTNWFGNFTSLSLGTNAANKISIANMTLGSAASNYLMIDYSGNPISAGGNDVLGFTYAGNPILATNVLWGVRVDNSAITASSSNCGTNVSFVNQALTVGLPGLVHSFDYQLVSAVNIAPIALGVSNVIPMTYVDLVADNESTNETITNFTVQVFGNAPDAKGVISVWRDALRSNAAAFDSNTMVQVTNAPFSGTASPVSLALFEKGQQRQPVLPTRYWFAVTLTNASAGLWSNTIGIKVTNMLAFGTNTNAGGSYGVVDSASVLSGASSIVSRVESRGIFADASTATNTNTVVRVPQGTFDTLAVKLVLTNIDADATNYLSGMLVTNLGTADNNDINSVNVYLDNGDGAFSSINDSFIFASPLGASRSVLLQTALVQALPGTNLQTLWVTYNTKVNAVVGHTVNLKVMGGSNFLWADKYSVYNFQTNQADARPTVFSSNLLPVSNSVATITPLTSQSFDFSVSSVSYSALPQAFTTNQLVPVGAFGLTMDSENTNIGAYSNAPISNTVFTGVQVKMASTNYGGDMKGWAYLYRDIHGTGAWSNDDTIIASNAVNGTGFSISGFNLSNVAVYGSTADTFFLVVQLTNAISNAMTNTVYFQITNLVTMGPDGGAVGSTNLFATASASSRIDSGEVLVNYISNALVSPTVAQTSVKNRALKMSLSGRDPDALNSLTSISVTTNGLSTVNVGLDLINQVSIEDTTGNFLGAGKITNGNLRIDLYTPEPLVGTNEKIYYLTFNVSAIAPIGSNIGFTVSNFGFGDPIADGYPQASFATGQTIGPTAATNAQIISLSYNPWDFQVIAASSAAPSAISISNEFAMHYFDLRVDTKSPANEVLTNVVVQIGGVAAALGGEIRLYRDLTNSALPYSSNAAFSRLVTNTFFAPGAGAASLVFSPENNLGQVSSIPDAFTRFWVALRLTNAPAAALWSNTIGLRVTNLSGTYSGIPAVFTNMEILTNAALALARVDSMQVTAAITSNVNGNIPEGSFNNVLFRLELTNADPDATNYLSGMVVTNIQNAGSTDTALFRIYRDNGDGAFNATTDTPVMMAYQGADQQFRLSASPTVAVPPGTNVFWGTLDMNLTATVNNKTALRIVPGTNGLTWVDGNTYPSWATYTQYTTNLATGPFPANPLTNTIVSFLQQPWDYSLQTVDYSNSHPTALTTNQPAAVASFTIYRDVDNVTQVFTNLGVAVLSSGAKNQVYGIASLWRETNNNAAFDPGDQIVGSNLIIGGANFSIPLAVSNVGLNALSPDKFYLVVNLTNNISNAWTNRFGFQITNLQGTGGSANDGLAHGLASGEAYTTNAYLFTNAAPADIMVDSYKVLVLALTNDIDTFFPKQYDQDHRLARLTLAGEDPDATNQVAYIDLMTNALSVNFTNDTVSVVKIATNTNGLLLGTAVSSQPFTTGASRLTFSPALKLYGTNAVNLWIGYDVGSSTNVVGKRLGFTITNGGIGLSDPRSDSGSMTRALSVATFAAGPAPVTNVVIYSYNSQPWDFSVVASRNSATAVIGVSNLSLMGSFDLMQDQESPATQVLTNVRLAVDGPAVDLKGRLWLFRDGGDLVAFDTNSDAFVTNAPFAGVGTYDLPVSQNGISVFGVATDPTRFFYGIEVTNASAFVFTNKVRLLVTNLMGNGPNAGVFQNSNVLGAVASTSSKVDDLRQFAYGLTNTNLFALQGALDTLALTLVMTNTDPDGTNWLSSLTLTNSGSSRTNEVSAVKFYRDNGDSNFDRLSDTLVGSALLGTNGLVNLAFSPQSLPTGEVRFFVSYDLAVQAETNRTVSFAVPVGGLGYYDAVADTSYASYNQAAAAGNPGVLPAANLSTLVNWADAQAYDAYVQQAVFTNWPLSIGTNGIQPVGYVDAFIDHDIVSNRLTNMVVAVQGVTAAVKGVLSVHRMNGPSNFVTNELLGSVAVNGSASPVHIPINTSNLAARTLTPPDATRLWLAFTLTNMDANAMTNTLGFQVSNLDFVHGAATAGVVVQSGNALTNRSAVSPVDSWRVNVLFVSNDLNAGNGDYGPKNNGRNNAYLWIRLAGEDRDQTAVMTALDIATNGLANAYGGTIGAVKVYTNKGAYDVNNGYFNDADLLGSSPFTNNSARVAFNVANLTLSGTNAYDLFVAYTVSAAASNVGRTIGLMITNGTAFRFGDAYGDGVAQFSYAASNTNGPAVPTNVVVQSTTSFPTWDFTLQQSRTVAPTSLPVSNTAALAYFDLMQDSQDPSTQVLTNLVVGITGAVDAAGQWFVVRDTNDMATFSTNLDKTVASGNFFPGTSAYAAALTESNIAITGVDTDATRFWVALRVTNSSANVWTNAVKVWVSNLMGNGPDAGTILNLSNLVNVPTAAVKVDDAWVTATAQSNTLTTAAQGSFDNFALRLTLSNRDPDATHWLTGITLTNVGNADTNDLGLAKVYKDDGDGVFDKAVDTLVGNASLNANKRYLVGLASLPIGTNGLDLWVSYDVKATATAARTNQLQIVAGGVSFGDSGADTTYQAVDQTATLLTAGALPSASMPTLVDYSTAQPWDYLVAGASWANWPQSITTNAQVPAGYVDLHQDTKIQALNLTNATVVVGGIAPDALGLLKLYRANGPSNFTTAELVGTAGVSGAGRVDIAIATSNLAVKTAVPPPATRFWLAYTLTNQADLALTNTLSLRLTNFSGSRAATATVLADYSGYLAGGTTVARIDSPEVQVLWVSNDLIAGNLDYSPKNNGRNNAYLCIRLAGKDPDAVNVLSAIDVITNGVSDALNNTITAVKIYSNKGAYDSVAGYFSDADLLGTATFSTNAARVALNILPLTLPGTNAVDLYVAYTIGAAGANVGRKVALSIPANAFHWSDTLADGWVQTNVVTGAPTGPALATNVVVVSSVSYPTWDFTVQQSAALSPTAVPISNTVALAYFDLFQDQESPSTQVLTNLTLRISGQMADAAGNWYVMRDTNDLTTFKTNEDLVVTNGVFSPGTSTYNVVLNETNVAVFGVAANASRYWLALQVTNNSAAVWTNKVSAWFTNLLCAGPNGGVLNNATNLPALPIALVRVDDNGVNVASQSNTVTTAAQGSFDTKALRLSITNRDPDAVHWLQSATFTNLGNATTNDLGLLKVFKDNGDGLFDTSLDTLVANAVYGTNNLYTVNLASLAIPTNGLDLWVSYDVKSTATPNKSVNLRVPAGGLVYVDAVVDSSFQTVDKLGVPLAAGPFPAVNSTTLIDFSTAQAWDFLTAGGSYSAWPTAISTNVWIPAGYLELYQDTKILTLNMTNLTVRVGGVAPNALGTLNLYRANGPSNFSTNGLVGTVGIGGAGQVDIPVTTSNLAVKTAVPPPATRFWLGYMLTNDVNLALTNTLSFWVTNVSGIASNASTAAATVLADYSGYLSAGSATARIDSPEVQVLFVSNDLNAGFGDYSPKANGRNNAYLWLRIAGKDPDATSILTSIVVKTNGLSDISNGGIGAVKIYSNKGAPDANLGYFNDVDLLGNVAFSTNAAKVVLNIQPLTMIGTNIYDLYVAYTISPNVAHVGKKVGLTIPTNAFQFSDPYSDGWPQTNWVTGSPVGPVSETNGLVISTSFQTWDLDMRAVTPMAPARAVTNLEWPILSVDCYRDAESGTETLRTIHLRGQSVGGKAYSGKVNVYYAFDSDGFTNFAAGTKIITNATLSSAADSALLDLGTPTINTMPFLSRFIITFQADSFDPLANVNFQITNWTCAGANGGQFNDPTNRALLSNKAGVFFDELRVTTTVSNLASGDLKQGSSGFALQKIDLVPVDADASVKLERLVFQLTSNSAAQDRFLSIRLYQESGKTAGFDTNDTALSGSVTFDGSTARVSLDSPTTVPAGGMTIYAVASADAGATVGNAVKVSLPLALQSTAFSSLQVAGTTVYPNLVPYGGEETAVFTIVRAIDFGADTIKPATTIVKPCEGALFRYYFKDAATAAKAKVHVHDAFGAWVRDLTVTTDTAEWDGSKRDGSSAASGFYSIVVEVDKVTVKRILVFLQRCK